MSEAAPADSAGHHDRLRRTVRRSRWWFVVALVLALLSIPALFDLHSLLVGLAVVTAGLGVLVAGFTWFDR